MTDEQKKKVDDKSARYRERTNKAGRLFSSREEFDEHRRKGRQEAWADHPYRVCKVCGQEKHLTSFRKDTKYQTVYRTVCRVCESTESAERARRMLRFKTLHFSMCGVCGGFVSNKKYHIDCAAHLSMLKNKIKYILNRDVILLRQRDRYYSDVDYQRSRATIYKHANPEKAALYDERRKVRLIAQSDGTLTSEALRRLFSDAKVCFYCGGVFDRHNHATLDHIVPVSRGGQHSIGNVVIACKRCNLKKGVKSVDEFLSDTQGLNFSGGPRA